MGSLQARGHEPAARLLLLLLLAGTLAWSAQAQDTRAAQVLLWRVSAPGATAYLLGSVHVARPDIYPLNPYIERAFADSSRLVVELDVRAVDQARLQQRIIELGMQPAGHTLSEGLSEKQVTSLEQRLEKIGVPLGAADLMKPWVVYTMLAALELAQLGYDDSNGIDLHFLQKAGDRAIIALESMDFQLELLAGFSLQDQLALLVGYLEQSPAAVMGSTATLFDAWQAGDEAGLDRIVHQDMASTEAGARVSQVMFEARHANMAAGIERLLMTPGTSFVIVGAGHLVGEGSVIDLLRGDGYEVSVVP
jgi:uncharacterized protein YbaP (TraB family)